MFTMRKIRVEWYEVRTVSSAFHALHSGGDVLLRLATSFAVIPGLVANRVYGKVPWDVQLYVQLVSRTSHPRHRHSKHFPLRHRLFVKFPVGVKL